MNEPRLYHPPRGKGGRLTATRGLHFGVKLDYFDIYPLVRILYKYIHVLVLEVITATSQEGQILVFGAFSRPIHKYRLHKKNKNLCGVRNVSHL